MIVPDLQTWDGSQVSRVFLAHVAMTRFDHVEFILQRDVAAAPEERQWHDQPRGRDRLELLDPTNEPPGYPPPRPQPTAYNEVWELAARNEFWRVKTVDRSLDVVGRGNRPCGKAPSRSTP